MGKGGGDGGNPYIWRPPKPDAAGSAECYRVSKGPSYPSPAEFGGKATSTTYAADGSQSSPDSSTSQSQNPTGSSAVIEEVPRLPGQATELAKLELPTLDSVLVKEVPRLPGEATELAANSVLLTPDSDAVEEVPEFPGQAKERATSGVPNPDSEALGCRNESSQKASVVQLHGAFLHGDRPEDPERAAEVSRVVTLAVNAFLLSWAPSLEYYLRQKLCEYFLPNGEKAGECSSKGNLAESSDSQYAKRTKLVVSKNFRGVRKRNNSISSAISLPGRKNKFHLGTFKTEEAAAQAFATAVDWRADRRGSKSFSEEELDDLKKRAEKASEHLSDDPSHHNFASPDLATALASLKGKAVAIPEHFSSHVSQQEFPARENFSSELGLDLSDWGNSFSELDKILWDNSFSELDRILRDNSFSELDRILWDNSFSELDRILRDNSFSELDRILWDYVFGSEDNS